MPGSPLGALEELEAPVGKVPSPQIFRGSTNVQTHTQALSLDSSRYKYIVNCALTENARRSE